MEKSCRFVIFLFCLASVSICAKPQYRLQSEDPNIMETYMGGILNEILVHGKK